MTRKQDRLGAVDKKRLEEIDKGLVESMVSIDNLARKIKIINKARNKLFKERKEILGEDVEEQEDEADGE